MSSQDQHVDHQQEQQQQHKPTVGEKISGTVEALVGKVTKNETKVVEGQAKKTGNEPTNANYPSHSQSQSHEATPHSRPDENDQFKHHHLGSDSTAPLAAPLAPVSGEGNTNINENRDIGTGTNNYNSTPYHTPTNIGGEGELGPGPVTSTSTGVNVITPPHPSHPVHGDSAPSEKGSTVIPESQIPKHSIEQQGQGQGQGQERDLRYPSTAAQGGVGSTGYEGYGGLPTGSGPAGNSNFTGQGDLAAGASGHHHHYNHEQGQEQQTVGGTAAGTGFQA